MGEGMGDWKFELKPDLSEEIFRNAPGIQTDLDPYQMGSSVEEITEKLGPPTDFVFGETPYWKMADGSVIIFDSTGRGKPPIALQVQPNGIHAFRGMGGGRYKERLDPEKGFVPLPVEVFKEEAPESEFDRMTEEELLRGLESIDPPDAPESSK